MARFQGKLVFITGGTGGGIGSEAAQLFANEGASVFITDLEKRGILTQLGNPPTITFQKCEGSSPEDCASAVTACFETFGALDALFRAAGMLGPPGTVVDHEVVLFRKTISTNVLSLSYLTSAAMPQMRKQGKGAIVTTASTTGCFGEYGISSYNAAKAGLINLTRTMALDHSRESIRIDCVCPGYTLTPMVKMGATSKVHTEKRALCWLVRRAAIIVDGGVLAGTGFPNTPRIREKMQQQWFYGEMTSFCR